MAKRLAMTKWYDPGLLIRTGIRAAVSTAFGHFADRREAIAAANAIQPTPADGEFDYSADDREDFWFDYLADTGDGWNPTFAMARLVAQEEVAPRGSKLKLPRGRLLVLGGDQVYPTADKDEYRIRFLEPFDWAYEPCKGAPLWTDEDRPDLYAIPGNHDWYDGLHAFFGLFCRRRVARDVDLGVSRTGKLIGGRQTRQTRSYFAIELPGKWWLWGTDSQLEGYIDQPQIDYFQHAATYWMEPGSKLILCVADPSWAYVDPKDPDKKFESFSYLERLAGSARSPAVDLRPKKWEEAEAGRWPEPGQTMGHELKLVLTGDSHHYCRYREDDRHYIVCGGGGAFLHPTHHLRDKAFKYRYPKPGSDGSEVPLQPGEDPGGHRFPRHFAIADKVSRPAGDKEAKALFPAARTSRGLSLRNLLFPILNWKFPLLLSVAYLVFNWILNFNAKTTALGSLGMALGTDDIGGALINYLGLIFVSPWAPILMGVALAGYYYFADFPTNRKARLLMGAVHSLFQALFVTLTTTLAIGLTADWWTGNFWSGVSLLLASLASGIVSAGVFGLYLLFCVILLRRHPNEGFSSIRIEGHKSFLRLKIATNGSLLVYPIGLNKVPRTRGWPWQRGGAPATPALDPHLIEGPITIAAPEAQPVTP
ncbi:MAG TPA: hypothetical protein VFZ91_05340 [Allosphingosinicella sp.]